MKTPTAMPAHADASQNFDVVIAGGGIGGCVAALALHRHVPEARVLLLEGGSYPRHKVCGEFFSPEGWAVLQRLGIDAELRARGAHPVSEARVLTTRAQTDPIPLPAPAWAISRWQLDDVLWQRAQKVCEARDHTHIRHIVQERGGFTVDTRDAVFRAKFVIDAMGRTAKHDVEAHHADAAFPAAAHLNTTHKEAPQPHTSSGEAGVRSGARYLGLKTHFLNCHMPLGEVQLFPFRGGYCGLIQVEEQRVNACLLTRYEVFDNPETLWQRALHENTALGVAVLGATQAMPWLATGNVTFGKMEPVCDGVLRCGDAAGYIQPFTGDGQAMAARGGELAAACIGAALRGGLRNADASELYAAAWRREFATRLNWGTRLQPLMLAPRAGEIAARLLTIVPGAARLIARRTRGA